MKDKIIKIAEDLKQGTITETKARTLLLGLFGVSNIHCNQIFEQASKVDDYEFNLRELSVKLTSLVVRYKRMSRMLLSLLVVNIFLNCTF